MLFLALLSTITACDVVAPVSPVASFAWVFEYKPCTADDLLAKLKGPIPADADLGTTLQCMRDADTHSPKPANGLHSVHQYGFPEEAGVYENGQRNGAFLYFLSDGTITKAERWEKGVLVELRHYEGPTPYQRKTAYSEYFGQ